MSLEDDIHAAEAEIAACRERLGQSWSDSKSAARGLAASPAVLAGALGLGVLIERRLSRPPPPKPAAQAPGAGLWGALTGIGIALAREHAKSAGADWLKDWVKSRMGGDSATHTSTTATPGSPYSTSPSDRASAAPASSVARQPHATPSASPERERASSTTDARAA